MKKKKNRFNIVKAVKENSRNYVGSVPTTKVIPHKHNRKEKYPKQHLETESEQ